MVLSFWLEASVHDTLVVQPVRMDIKIEKETIASHVLALAPRLILVCQASHWYALRTFSWGGMVKLCQSDGVRAKNHAAGVGPFKGRRLLIFSNYGAQGLSSCFTYSAIKRHNPSNETDLPA